MKPELYVNGYVWILTTGDCSDRNNIYNYAEAKVTYYCKLLERLFLGTTLLYVMTPVIREYNAVRAGISLVSHADVGFFKDLWLRLYYDIQWFLTFFVNRYFFDATKSPMRELAFITQTFGLFAVVILFLTVDLLFSGLCIYIAAMYKELQRMLGCIDLKSKNLETHNDKSQNIRLNLRNCIEFHMVIIRWV